jgi:hypothetical protein
MSPIVLSGGYSSIPNISSAERSPSPKPLATASAIREAVFFFKVSIYMYLSTKSK